MSYDLALRRRLQRDYSRGDEPRPPRAHTGASLALAALTLLLPSLARRAESAAYRRSYGRGLKVTQEVPAVTMHEIVYGRKE